jgi:hypothetical protein
VPRRDVHQLSIAVVAVVLGSCGALLLLIGLGWAVLVHLLGSNVCQLGDSNYGELSWSVLPPGPVCTWTAERDGFDYVEGPSHVVSVWLLVIAAIGAAAAWTSRLAVRTDATNTPSKAGQASI